MAEPRLETFHNLHTRLTAKDAGTRELVDHVVVQALAYSQLHKGLEETPADWDNAYALVFKWRDEHDSERDLAHFNGVKTSDLTVVAGILIAHLVDAVMDEQMPGVLMPTRNSSFIWLHGVPSQENLTALYKQFDMERTTASIISATALIEYVRLHLATYERLDREFQCTAWAQDEAWWDRCATDAPGELDPTLTAQCYGYGLGEDTVRRRQLALDQFFRPRPLPTR